MKTYEGKLTAEGFTFGIVLARFNEFIGGKLRDGAIDALIRHGARAEDVETVWVPGAFEIPLMAKQMAISGRYDAIICLGAVIRGATSHYELVTSEVAKGIAAVSLDHQMPVLFGILTTDTLEQAIERAGTKAGNKGFDAAVSAIEMVNLIQAFQTV